ncbi:hypothetical protein B566_EDAN001686 [Ephemera danica]|nr:hypothetical protein B566_EDAN001686 [Ephemera danica]
MGGGSGVREDQWPVLAAAMYGLLSFTVVLAAALLLLFVCRRRYALNWFEKNLLESANADEMSQSEEALIPGGGEDATRCGDANEQVDKFWIPPTVMPRSTSSVIPAHEASAALAVDPITSVTSVSATGSQDETDAGSGPQTPKTPLSANSVNEKLPGYKPRVSSMQTRLDHTKIDTTLYQTNDGGTENMGPSLGAVHLTLVYDQPAGILSVRLLEAQDLRARDFSGTADPYAKIRLLPDRNNVWQTRIHKKTLNPVFDEDFVFEVATVELARRTLEVLLYDFDAYSRHQCIGGAQLPLAPLELTHKVTLWKHLTPHNLQDAKVELGDLMVSLSFLPSAERLTIVILKARNLRVVDDARSTSDPYVRVIISGGGGRRARKKRTSVQRGTVNPVFNEAITFDVTREALSRSTLEFCVLSDEKVLGVARVASPGDQTDFFKEMLTSRTATARWLPLYEPD